MIDQVRQTIRRLQPSAGLETAGNRPFGIVCLDAALGGGLARGALHEIAASRESHIAAATGFTLGLLDRKRAAVWIAEDMARLESGAPCGAGLDETGIAPERLLAINVAHPRDLLWAMEEALRCRAAGAVIGELRSETLDPVALRRLSLAAAASGALAFLLRCVPPSDASTAATRWIVEAVPSLPRHGPNYVSCAPRLSAQLVRNRRGPRGSWTLEWSDIDERFVLASTHPQPVAQPAIDRPVHAAIA